MQAHINGAQIHYRRDGSGLPILFIHAGIADSRMWEPQVPALSPDFELIRPDLRGYGDSELPRVKYAMRDDLVGLMDELRLDRFHLVGCSMGGSVAIDLAIEHPERVGRLVLVGAGVGGADMGASDRPLFADADAAWEKRDLEALNRAEVRLWVDGPRRAEGAAPAAVRELVLDMNGRAMQSDFEAAPHQGLEPPAIGRLEEIKAPTLIIAGDEDLPHILATADLLSARIAGARKVVIHDAAHLPNLEHPDEFNRLLLDFLRA